MNNQRRVSRITHQESNIVNATFRKLTSDIRVISLQVGSQWKYWSKVNDS